MLLWTILLALMWAMLNGGFTTGNLIAGAVLGYLALALLASRGIVGSPAKMKRLQRSLGFVGYFLYELVVSNLKVAVHVLQPKPRFRPAVVAVPLDVDSDAEIALLSNLICLTPGTLTVDVSTDKTTMYVHSLDAGDDLDELRRSIKDGLERRVKELFAQ